MKDAILTYLKTTAGAHVRALVIVAVALVGGRAWLAEHDARLQADNTVKLEQAQIDALKTQQSAVESAAKVQIVQLQASASKVTTTPEAVAALASVTPAATATNSAPELDAVALPDAPTKVSVDAVPLYQDLNVCRQNTVNLGACTAELSLQKQMDTDKDTQIAALKKKPGFWKRVLATAKAVGVGVGIGIIVAGSKL